MKADDLAGQVVAFRAQPQQRQRLEGSELSLKRCLKT